MAARAVAHCLRASRKPPIVAGLSVVQQRASFVSITQKYYHGSQSWHNVAPSSFKTPGAKDPIAESVEKSSELTEDNSDSVNRHAAFLGEADSDDGFEAHVEAYPEAHRHNLADVNTSGLHGQAGEGDEPIEREKTPHEPLHESHSAYLGEADSNSVDSADREQNPEKYRHRIDDAASSGIHGTIHLGITPV